MDDIVDREHIRKNKGFEGAKFVGARYIKFSVKIKQE